MNRPFGFPYYPFGPPVGDEIGDESKTLAIGRAERCMQVFSSESIKPNQVHCIDTSPYYYAFRGLRLCVTKNINKFRIVSFQVGVNLIIDIDLPAVMFPILPDFSKCNAPKDFEDKVAELIKIDYQSCLPGQRMRLAVKNISKKSVNFEAVMHGIRTF